MTKPESKRRRFGFACIAVAVLMVIVGVTLLGPMLARSRMGFVLYWLICFGFTMLAVVVALVDALRVHGEGRNEQRNLLEDTLREVEKERQKSKNSKK